MNIRWIFRRNQPLTQVPPFGNLAANMDAFSLPALSPPDEPWKGVGDQTPPPGKLVLYRTSYYQMMGYLNRLGRWIGSDGKEETFPVRWWREVGEELSRWPNRALPT